MVRRLVINSGSTVNIMANSFCFRRNAIEEDEVATNGRSDVTSCPHHQVTRPQLVNGCRSSDESSPTALELVVCHNCTRGSETIVAPPKQWRIMENPCDTSSLEEEGGSEEIRSESPRYLSPTSKPTVRSC